MCLVCFWPETGSDGWLHTLRRGVWVPLPLTLLRSARGLLHYLLHTVEIVLRRTAFPHG